MNILFVLYGDFISNSANSLALYARELQSRGHSCAIAVPSNLKSISLYENPAFIPILYEDVLAAPESVFPDKRPADVIHACTPREGVRNFVTSYMIQRPTPLVIYLEDNESWIATHYIGLDESTVFNYSDKEISERIPDILSHPFRYDSFIGLADAVAVIQDKIKPEVPPWVHCETVMIGVDLDLFSPRQADISLLKKYGVKKNERVIVYHGGVDMFKGPAIESLCKAIGLINQQGYPCRLLRSGLQPLDFLKEMPNKTRAAISDLGMLPKDDLPGLLALADVFVQPGEINPYEDLRLPGKVPEFLAMARPVIMPDVNIAYLFNDWVDAVILQTGSAEEIANKCIELFSDTSRANKIGNSGRLLAEKYFDVRTQAGLLENIYKSACENFHPENAARIWGAMDEDVPIALLLARKLRILTELDGAESHYDRTDILKEHARYIEFMQQRADGMENSLIERDSRLKDLYYEVHERENRLKNLYYEVAERERRIENLYKTISEREAQINSLECSIIERDQHHDQYINNLLTSTSWRLTRPVRYIGTQWKRIKNILHRAVRIHQNDEMTGVRSALAESHTPVSLQPIESAQTSSEVASDMPVIPRIGFDDTFNRFVEYQENPPINPLVKLIAFYLPQFHPFPENDEWWGKGFTEWTNVGKALPNFVGHYQPHCPIHFGYYDLRIPEVMQEQARLAKEYGIYGFSYYFYWFDGKILMETPLESMLVNKKVNMPFCMTWANENWSRKWDGQEKDVLIAQNHSNEDSLAFIRHLVKYFKDERYIRIDGKPILIIYRADIIPDMANISRIWREELLKHGIPGLYLASAQSFGISSPEGFDFDASIEFPPHIIPSHDMTNELELVNTEFNGHIYSYEQVAANAVLSKEPDYKLFRTAMLSWDNTARQQNNSNIFHDFSLLRYKQWLSSIVNKVHSNPKYTADEKIVFVNAWNEWAEGTHLEPDQKFGYGYLQTTYDVLRHYESFNLTRPSCSDVPIKQSDYAVIIHLHYDELWPNMRDYLMRPISDQSFDLYASVTSSSAAKKILEDFPDAFIVLVENRGRDILPFIRMLKLIKNIDYTAVCKIHSKRSVYRNDGDKIRDEIFNALMGSKEQVEEILSRFRNNAQLGMVVPKNYLVEHNDHNMTFDKEVVKRISSHMKIDFTYDLFPAGSMFWFSPKSLEPLLTVDDSFFEIESGLADGTSAHAVERMFCQIVKDRNYTIESC